MKKLIIFTILISGILLFSSNAVFATNLIKDLRDDLNKSATEGGINIKDSAYVIVSRVIKTVLGTMGILILLIIIYASFMYLTASGNAEQAKKATSMLAWAVIGLIVVFGAYIASNYVVEQLGSTTLVDKK